MRLWYTSPHPLTPEVPGETVVIVAQVAWKIDSIHAQEVRPMQQLSRCIRKARDVAFQHAAACE